MKHKRKVWLSVIAGLMAAVLLTGCGAESVMNTVASQLSKTMSVNRTISSDSKWINSSIDGAIDETLQVSEKDDFYTAVNKDWILNAKVDKDTASVGALQDNGDVVKAQTNQILEESMTAEHLSGENNIGMPEEQYQHTEELLGKFANQIADADGRDAQGVEPARAYVEAVENIENLDEMTAYIENKDGRNFSTLSLIPVSMEIPRSEHDSYTVYLGQYPALNFAAPDSYTNVLSQDVLIKELLVENVGSMLVQLGYSEKEAKKMVRNSLQFEGRLAEAMDKQEGDTSQSLEDYKEMDHFYSFEDLKDMEGNYPLTEILTSLGLEEAEVINIENEEYIRYVGRLYKEKNLRKIKDYMIVNTLVDMMPYLGKTSYEAYNTLAGIKYGYQMGENEEDRISNLVSEKMSAALQEIYVGRYCDAEQKQALEGMIDEIIMYYRNMLQEEEWLTEETRKLAIEKLDNICYRVLYPNKMPDYTEVVFEQEDTLIDMIAKLNQFDKNHLKDKVNKEVDRYDWDMNAMSTLVVNAYYMPTDNSINILAGILANGFVYDKDAPEEMNLARIGAIVGHEITHGFDTNGYSYDKDGIPNKWWTYEDEEQFQIRANHLAKYFSALSPYPGGGAYNGSNVKGEAIADMGGVKCMLGIAREREDFDYDLFFTSYAQLWRSKSTLATELAFLNDEHPLDCFRVNVTLQQFDEFMETYDIKPGDGMYLSPEKRIVVW